MRKTVNNPNTHLSAERLRELLKYDPETGDFYWVTKHGHRKPNDRAAARVGGHGYRTIAVDKTNYLAHRLAWLYMTGEWPAACIDHINRDRSDNRFCNLRPATMSNNQHNRPRTKRNKSGVKGVFWNPANKKWRALISVNWKSINIGCFSCLGQAAAARKEAERRYHGEYAGVEHV